MPGTRKILATPVLLPHVEAAMATNHQRYHQCHRHWL